MSERERLLQLLAAASEICYDLKIKNVCNPGWYHFDAAWEYISRARKEVETTAEEEKMKTVYNRKTKNGKVYQVKGEK